MSARHSDEHARPGKGSGYMRAEIVGCQFSVYPLRQEDVDGPVQAAILAAREEGCTVRVANLSTLLSGSEDQVFAGLRAAFRAAQRQGPAVMAATLASGMPTDGLVDEIQQGLDARGPSSQAATSGQGRPPDSRTALGAGSRPTGAPSSPLSLEGLTGGTALD